MGLQQQLRRLLLQPQPRPRKLPSHTQQCLMVFVLLKLSVPAHSPSLKAVPMILSTQLPLLTLSTKSVLKLINSENVSSVLVPDATSKLENCHVICSNSPRMHLPVNLPTD